MMLSIQSPVPNSRSLKNISFRQPAPVKFGDKDPFQIEMERFFNTTGVPPASPLLKALQKPFLKVGSKVYTGLNLLNLLAILPSDRNGDRYLGDLFNRLLPKPHRGAVFHADAEVIADCLVTLEQLGCIKATGAARYFNASELENFERFAITQIASRVLTEDARLQSAQSAQKVKEANRTQKPSEITAPSKPDVSAITYDKVDTPKLKLLVSGPEGGMSGWTLLKTITEVDNTRYYLSRKLRPGLSEQRLVGHLYAGGKPAESFLKQLSDLKEHGLLDNIGTEENPRWQPTPLGKRMIALANPLSPGGLKSAEMERLIQYDIDRLSTARKEKEARLAKQEAELKKTEALVQTSRTNYDKAIQEVQSLNAKLEEAQRLKRIDTGTAERSAETIRRKTLDADLIKAQVEAGDEVLSRLRQTIEVQRNQNREWELETHSTLKRLMAAKLRAQTLSEETSLAQLLQGGESLDIQGADLLETLEQRHFKTQAQLDELAAEAHAGKLVNEALLKDLVATLPQQAPGRKSASNQ